MATVVRKTRNGRHVLILDGCSDYYGGATIQGAIVCRISLPPEFTPIFGKGGLLWFTDPRYPGVYRWAPDIAQEAGRGEIPGARVYEFRYIQ